MTYPVFASGDVLNASDMNAVSGWLVKSQTVGSGVSSVTVTGAFSTDYENYRIIISGVQGSVSNAPLTMAFNGSTGNTFKSTSAYMIYGATGFNGYAPANATVFRVGWTDTAADINVCIDLLSPFLTKPTTFTSQGSNLTITYQSSGVDTASLSSTAFTIAGDTFTGGQISVYGYRK